MASFTMLYHRCLTCKRLLVAPPPDGICWRCRKEGKG